MKAIVLHEQAEVELWQAVDYYETTRNGLGLEFERAVSGALEEIQEGARTAGVRQALEPAVTCLGDFLTRFTISRLLTPFGWRPLRIRSGDPVTGASGWVSGLMQNDCGRS